MDGSADTLDPSVYMSRRPSFCVGQFLGVDGAVGGNAVVSVLCWLPSLRELLCVGDGCLLLVVWLGSGVLCCELL